MASLSKKNTPKKWAAAPLPKRHTPSRHPMPAAKKSAKLSPAIIKQRRETIETRIVKLEGKLNKDRTLLLRYTAEEESAERSEEAVATTE